MKDAAASATARIEVTLSPSPRVLNRYRLALAGIALGAAACSSDVVDDPGADGSPSAPALGTDGPSPAGPNSASGGSSGTSAPSPSSGVSPGVANYDRPLGMPIGQGAAGPGDPSVDPETPAAPDDGAQVVEEVQIPVFMPADQGPPCSGCVELMVDVNDINQRDNFVFAAGGVNTTRVVWTLIIPFNSDQLFVQPFVDNAYGTFTDLDANAFAVNAPVELPQTKPASAAGNVGLAVGSSGAWTGNMTMSVFVDSVTLEGGGTSVTRTFDNGLEGFAVASNAHNPKVVHHP